MFLTIQNGADLLYHRAKFSVAGTSHAARGAKSLIFALFVRHAFGRTDCERHITMKELDLRNKFGTVV